MLADLPLAAMAEALAKSSDHRVLRRLVRREAFTPSDEQVTKTGILIDVETTGLDQHEDEVIELGMVKFDYVPRKSRGTRGARPLGVFDENSSAVTYRTRRCRDRMQ